MKKIACLLIFIMLGLSTLMAQSLETLGYQAVVRDNANKLVTEQNIVLDITISVNSTIEYTETRTVHSNKNGMVSFSIGDADRSSHTNELSDISDWKHAVVQVVYHLNADQGGDVTTTDPITATPYAFQADTASVVNPTYINNVVADSIADPTSEINLAIDTMIQNAITAASLNCDDIADCVTSEIRTNNTDLINAIDSVTYQNTLDSIAVASSELNLAIDTIVGNAFSGLCDSIENCANVALRGEDNTFSDKNTFTDTVYVNNGAVQADGTIATTDSLRAVNAKDLVTYTSNAIHDSIVNNISSQIQDSINNHLAEYGIQDCEDVTDCVVSALEDGTSDINHRVDTIAENVTLTELRDGNSDINHTVDTIAEKVILTELQDGTSDVNHTVDTIVEKHLLPYEIKNCGDVNACVVSALEDGTSDINHRVDTIVENALNNYEICDKVAECIITNADTKENIIKLVSDTLANANSNLHYIVDTIAGSVVAANQVQSDWTQTDATAPDYIKNKPTNLATTDGDNNFTGDNTFAGDNYFTGENRFTDTVVVPSGFDIDTTNATNCKDLAVNACDLFTVFDSLQRRFDQLEDEINRLRDTIRDLRAATPPTWISTAFDPTATTIKADAKFHDGGATITNYHFCISANADMSGESCYDTDTCVYNFTGLNPATTYYIAVTGTNMLGSDISDTLPCTTPALKPTAGTPTAGTEEPNGFEYTLPDITTGGAPNAELQFCYGKGGDCDTVTYLCFTKETVTAGNYTRTVTGLIPGETYCMKTEVSTNNGDSVLYVDPITYTVPTVEPVLGAPVAVDKTSRTFDIEVPITNNGGADITSATICVYSDADCTTPAGGICAASVTINPDELSATITGLEPATCYYIKATATNDTKTGSSKSSPNYYCTDPEIPVLGTPASSSTTQTGFNATVPVISTGGATINSYTLKAYTDPDCATTPIEASSVSYSGGNITGTFSGLDPNTKYYFTASATNAAGTGYSDTSNVTTSDFGAPVVTATSSSATTNSVTVSGKLTDYGAGATSATVTACAYTSSDYTGTPVCSSSSNISGTIPSGGKDYSLTISGLNPDTQYYIKVTADNGHKTGNATKSQKTQQAVTLSVTTSQSSPLTICYGSSQTVTYTATLSGASASSYSWTTSGACGAHTETTTTNTYTVTVSGAGNVNVSCTAGGKTASHTSLVAVYPSVAPYITSIVTDFNTLKTEVKATNCTGLVWKNQSGSNVGSGATYQATSAGFYTVSGTTSDGCETQKSVYIGPNPPAGCIVADGTARSNETYNSATHLVTEVSDAGYTYEVLSISGVCITKTNIRRTTSPNGYTFADNHYSSFTESRYKVNTEAGTEGVYYNWHAAMDLPTNKDARDYGDVDFVNHRGICPEGWHLPTTSEWNSITHYYNASQVAVPTTGDNAPWKLSGGTGHAGNPSTSQRNITSLGIYPAGGFGHDSGVYNHHVDADFWTATSQSAESNTKAFSHYCFYYNDWFGAGQGTKDVGRSVRCVRD